MAESMRSSNVIAVVVMAGFLANASDSRFESRSIWPTYAMNIGGFCQTSLDLVVCKLGKLANRSQS